MLHHTVRTIGITCTIVLLTSVAHLRAGPVDYAKPMIGTDEHGHVYPGATVPFGMIQLSPDTRDDTWDGCSGYHYSDTSIMGFSHNHLTGTGCADLGNVLLMPTVGPVKLTAGKKPGDGYRASFSHSDEEARPGYYRVLLKDYNVNVELTATIHAGMHRYTFPQSSEGHVVLDLWHGVGNRPTDSQITLADDHTLTGYRRSNGWGGDKIYYFVIEFSRPFDTAGLVSDQKAVAGKEAKGKNLQAHVDFKTSPGEKILARAALSTVSVEGARKNLQAEIPNWDFDALATAARATWDKALSVAEIETKDQALQETFYTALYHAYVAPTILNDVDGQFRGPDGQVHQAHGFNFYSELSLWDTFRAENPLLTLVQPQRVNDLINTMLTHFTLFGQGTLPVWTESGKENWCMIGNHAIPVIVDAYNKGFRQWDAAEALADMISSTSKDREQQDQYRALGYVPQQGKNQSTSKTLEYAYDDICIARFAKALGKADVAATYAKRSQNWQNVFDPATGFTRGRLRDGKWATPFDPKRIEFEAFTEANAWQYTFFVPHDVPGLIAKLGGDDKFVAKLDEMFDTKERIPNELPDVTGLIGMYAHGNEPCHHVAYLYNYAGQAWKTQARTRKVATFLYNNTNGGICGNDDCGQMSAWYVFTALGFYPVDPASNVYVIGSPFVDRITIALDPQFYKGGKFTVIAKDNSPANVYIQSATLDGKPYTRSWITQEQIAGGSTLVLQMGPTPNKAWGSAQEDRPGQAAQL